METAAARTGEQKAHGYTVVHRSAGRLRLRLDSPTATQATAFATALALHPSTTEVRWVPAARSMTLRHDPSVPPERILSSARQARRVATVVVEVRTGSSSPTRRLMGLLTHFGAGALLADTAAALLAPPASEVVGG
ncbi:MAG: hypothetical protein ACR2MY_11475, partial [Candidatus Dormibacteria bacterium]